SNNVMTGDAYERLIFTNDSASTHFGIVIASRTGTAGGDPHHVKYLPGPLTSDGVVFNSHTGTIFGHTEATGVIAVAAERYNATTIEPFSSSGTTPIYLNRQGAPLTPAPNRTQP